VFDDRPAVEAGNPGHSGRKVAAKELAGLPWNADAGVGMVIMGYPWCHNLRTMENLEN